MMTHGWVVPDDKGKIQHVRAALIPDPMADESSRQEIQVRHIGSQGNNLLIYNFKFQHQD